MHGHSHGGKQCGGHGGSAHSHSHSHSHSHGPPCGCCEGLRTWFKTRVTSHDHVVLLESFEGTPLCTVWAVLLLLLNMAYVNKGGDDSSSKGANVLRFLLFLCNMLSVLVFFDGSNKINSFRFERARAMGEASSSGSAWDQNEFLWDANLLGADDTLLGWLFPSGQLSLWLDTNETIGVRTVIAQCYTEVLQVLYVSYYFWGNGMGIYLAYKLFTTPGTHTHSRAAQWRRLQVFVTAWAGTFLFNFVLNMMVPAVSPRIYIAHAYRSPIKGLPFGVADTLRAGMKNAAANTFAAFPSGHCGLSWLTAYLANRMNMRVYSKITLVVAVLITTATLVLRYHYFIDMLGAIFLLRFGVWFAGIGTRAKYARLVRGEAALPRPVEVELGLLGNDGYSSPKSGGAGTHIGDVKPLGKRGVAAPKSLAAALDKV